MPETWPAQILAVVEGDTDFAPAPCMCLLIIRLCVCAEINVAVSECCNAGLSSDVFYVTVLLSF